MKPLIYLLTLGLGSLSSFAQTSAFTYQGRLAQAGQPANGSYVFTFQLFGSAASHSALTPPLTNTLEVSDGLFTAHLDFGADPFDGRDLWLEVRVSPDLPRLDFQTLSPRQRITSAPYALLSGTVADGAITSAKLAAGAVGGAQLASNAVTSLHLTAGAVRASNIVNGTITDRQLAPGAAFSNLLAQGLSAVPSGAVVLSPDSESENLAQAGYVKIGRLEPTRESWTSYASGSDDSGLSGRGRQDHSAVWTGSEMIVWGGYNGAHLNDGFRYRPSLDTWQAVSLTNAPAPRSGHFAFWTGSRMLIWGESTGNGGRYDPVTDTWSTMSQTDGLWKGTAVWCGTQMIVWRCYPQQFMGNTLLIVESSRYDPIANVWSSMTTTGQPTGREGYSMVAIGSKAAIWGGTDRNGDALNDGAIYDPAADSWTPIPTNGAPSARAQHQAVWISPRLVILGGTRGTSTRLSDGGRYDTTTGTWSPITPHASLTNLAGRSFTAVGNRVAIWGPHPTNGLFYYPSTDNWGVFSSSGAPPSRWDHSAVWTGSRFIVWGGSQTGGGYADSGGRYDPTTDTWFGMSTPPMAPEPAARAGATAVWTGTEMVVWGGENRGQLLRYGSRFSPALNTWFSMSLENAPSARTGHTAVWTGSKMLVWGGVDMAETATGGVYAPATDTWTPMSTTAAPLPRQRHTAVWTGRYLLVWGGLTEESPVTTAFFFDGGRYDPGADQWSALATNSAPAARAGHTAVWDGSQMIVWGGYHLENRDLVTVYHDDGARYELSRDRWLSLPFADAPSARRNHTAIWTGSDMIVWGGDNGTNLDTGAVFEGATRTWVALPSCPTNMARSKHAAVFDGVHMLIWGGRGTAGLVNSGLIYNPLAQTWQSITTAGAPSAREGQVAVWTGEQWLIWGGRNGNSYYKDTFGYTPPRTSYLYLKP